MDIAALGFASYQLVNVATGIPLYETTATPAEILEANANLRQRGLASRYFPTGSYHAPLLHGG